MRGIDWNLLKALGAVIDAGSLSAAAKATGVSQPTLGRHIDRLETALGATLFVRGRAGMTPTPAALRIAEAAQAMRAAEAAVSMQAAGHASELKGVVRISASEIFATFFLPAILGDLLAQMPAIEIELAASNDQADLMARDADIAVRMVRPMQNDLIARKVNDMATGAFAHAGYLERFAEPADIAGLAGHAIVGFDRSDLVIRGFAAAGLKVGRDFFRFRCDDQAACWRAVCDGVGIGFGPLALARREPALRRILQAYALPSLPVWLVSHRELRTSARIRAVSDFLGERLAQLELGE